MRLPYWALQILNIFHSSHQQQSLLLHPRPLPLLVPFPQFLNPLIACTSIPHFLVIYEIFTAAGIFPLSHFTFAVEVCAADVESVDVTRNDACEEEEAVD